MILTRMRLLVAGLVAVALGFPLASETFGQGLGWFVGGVIDASVAASDGGGS